MFRKFAWVGNRISDEDMSKLYQIKRAQRIPITKLVATAVKEFIAQTEQQAVFREAEIKGERDGL